MKKMVQYEDPIYYDSKITECKTLGDILKITTHLINLYGKEACIDFSSGYCNINEHIYTIKEREETNSEYQFRLKQEQKKEDKERKEYERLKAKFGDK